jgi:hypothetical protein
VACRQRDGHPVLVFAESWIVVSSTFDLVLHRDVEFRIEPESPLSIKKIVNAWKFVSKKRSPDVLDSRAGGGYPAQMKYICKPIQILNIDTDGERIKCAHFKMRSTWTASETLRTSFGGWTGIA